MSYSVGDRVDIRTGKLMETSLCFSRCVICPPPMSYQYYIIVLDKVKSKRHNSGKPNNRFAISGNHGSVEILGQTTSESRKADPSPRTNRRGFGMTRW